MPLIHLTTHIDAPIERVFDLARSVDVHRDSTELPYEIAVEGRYFGLMKEGETVTREATHFGIRQRLKVKVTKLERASAFEYEMISGAFSSMSHVLRFEEKCGKTEMTDEFEFRALDGFFWQMFEQIFLTNYMKSFLMKRNEKLKELAESSRWKAFRGKPPERAGHSNGIKPAEVIEAFRGGRISEEAEYEILDESFRKKIYELLLPLPERSDNNLLRRLLDLEIEHREDGCAVRDDPEEYLENIYRCGLLLYLIGNINDVYALWRAKQATFDTYCCFDTRLLLGAGEIETKKFLEKSDDPEAKEIFEFLLFMEELASKETQSEEDDVEETMEEWLKQTIEYYSEV